MHQLDFSKANRLNPGKRMHPLDFSKGNHQTKKRRAHLADSSKEKQLYQKRRALLLASSNPESQDQTAAVTASNPLESVASAFLDVGGFFSGPKSSTKKERRSGGGFVSGSEPHVPDVDEIMAAASRSGVDMSNAAELTQFTKDYAHSK